MSNAIEKVEVSPPAVQTETQAVLSMIERAATDPKIGLEKMERMLDMQERILNRNAKQAFTADLASMQVELPRVMESGEGHNKAKYAKLEDINDAVRPVLNKYGFAITFRVNQQQGAISIKTVLSHREGHSEETEIVLPADASGSKNAVQAVGSSVSYGKRYGICAMLNISTGDDNDGANNGNLLSASQIQNLEDLTLEVGADRAKFLAYIGVSDFSQLPANKYGNAVKALNAKRGKK